MVPSDCGKWSIPFLRLKNKIKLKIIHLKKNNTSKKIIINKTKNTVSHEQYKNGYSMWNFVKVTFNRYRFLKDELFSDFK